MIQKHHQMNESVKYLGSSIEKNGPYLGQIQKIFSTTRTVCITIRFFNATKYVYIGRGKGVEGVWMGKAIPPTMLRIRDRFLEYLRKYLMSARIEMVSLDEKDRILSVKYHPAGAGVDAKGREKGQQLVLFWHKRELLFANSIIGEGGKWKVFYSALGKHLEYSQLLSLEEIKKTLLEQAGVKKLELIPSAFLPVGESFDLEKDIKIIEKIMSDESSKVIIKEDKKKSKFLERKRDKILKDLAESEQWKKLVEMVNPESFLIELEQLQGTCTLLGIKFKFAKELSPYKKRDLVYKKIKKLRKGNDILEQRLQDVTAEMDIMEKKQKDRERGREREADGIEGDAIIDRKYIVSPLWKDGERTWSAKDKDKGSIDRDQNKEMEIFELSNGMVVAVGKSAQGNDQIRNSWAGKEDLWFHIDGYKGAHAVVKAKSIAEIPEKDLSLVGSSLAEFSKIQLISIPLVYTQVKNIKGVKQESGKVIISKQKHIQVDFEQNWKGIVHRFSVEKKKSN
ncbi:MAG: DUF814 domain-containing protein [Oligoflexia bacterium]|nr:DUF814 domain-containing protein [Oligoflexia bacterium]MBF0367703.1 DUF814 domain-containing protein [Oligoflexia bacterium]